MSRARRLLAIGLPAMALSGLALASAAQEQRGDASVPICRHRQADGAGSRKADLGAPERERARAEKTMRAALASLDRKGAAWKDEGYDSGLPGCRRGNEEERLLAQPLPEVFRGRSLYFLRLGKGGRCPQPFAGALRKEAIVFLTGCHSLADAGELARATGARVSMGTAELASKVGVRCAGSRVDVSADGRSLRLTEVVP